MGTASRPEEDWRRLVHEVGANPNAGHAILDPAILDVLGHVADSSTDEIAAALLVARHAQKSWAGLTDDTRRSVLHRAAEAVDRESEALAQLLTREQGKPLNGPGARFEVQTAVQWLHETADLPFPGSQITETARMVHEPLGVVAAISPWNWPIMIAMWQISAALRMGNAVIAKPSEYTPLSGLALGAVLNRVLPHGVLQTLTGAGEVGATLTRSPGVDKIMFTGSVATGKRIVEASAESLPRLTLELGGNDAAIILPDADIEALAENLFWGAFSNSGQTCAAVKRLYVHESRVNEIVHALTLVAADVRIGPGTDEEVSLGPVQNEMQLKKVTALVADAEAGGARSIALAEVDRQWPGYFHNAALVVDIANDAALVQEEQFGPVLPIVTYADIDEAVSMANDCAVGLGASVWGEQAGASVVARRLDAGTVWINAHGAVSPTVPFGGIKQSGYGLEFGVDGLRAVSRSKVLVGEII